ncbi:hypothetical protein KIN20_010611 [Parelaphostrongylus tenuis]|uniref:Uncharacterized protein n=1 Tax=Parelaphostrongylus tenuis TaxID=148309 RepID=A0AAD5MZ79_PARTN|nr:hypothetical protein KIN20_010611 [Parelaphostrongylus tenuis]
MRHLILLFLVLTSVNAWEWPFPLSKIFGSSEKKNTTEGTKAPEKQITAASPPPDVSPFSQGGEGQFVDSASTQAVDVL